MIRSSIQRFVSSRLNVNLNRFGHAKASTRFISSSDLIIEHKTDRSDFEKRPEKENLSFGSTFTDHMLTIEWDTRDGWSSPKILPFQELKLHPAATSLHYGEQYE